MNLSYSCSTGKYQVFTPTLENVPFFHESGSEFTQGVPLIESSSEGSHKPGVSRTPRFLSLVTTHCKGWASPSVLQVPRKLRLHQEADSFCSLFLWRVWRYWVVGSLWELPNQLRVSSMIKTGGSRVTFGTDHHELERFFFQNLST